MRFTTHNGKVEPPTTLDDGTRLNLGLDASGSFQKRSRPTQVPSCKAMFDKAAVGSMATGERLESPRLARRVWSRWQCRSRHGGCRRCNTSLRRRRKHRSQYLQGL